MRSEALHVVPSLGAGRGPGGSVVLTRKFIDGAREYAERWPGPVIVFFRESPVGRNLDESEVDPGGLPFEFRWLDAAPASAARQVGGGRLVLCSLVDRLTPVARACSAPVVLISEYTRRTRAQIIDAETAGALRRMRRHLHNVAAERRYVAAVRAAAGIQTNGTPTWDAYHRINPRPLLYFDTRVRRDMLAREEVVAARTATMLAGGPIRLAFSGRLAAMKGADHLPRVAAELRRLGVPFHLTICGAGPQQRELEDSIRRERLESAVTLAGVLDFRDELMPFVARDVDLFVCCHRQGDPSCTYLETMSCGTPIAGYDNEAFRGIVRHAGVGWTAPLDDPAALAATIAGLDRNRAELAKAALDSLEFARRHTFEQTMQMRVDHMLVCSGAGRREGAA